jgi:hypothetical protein
MEIQMKKITKREAERFAKIHKLGVNLMLSQHLLAEFVAKINEDMDSVWDNIENHPEEIQDEFYKKCDSVIKYQTHLDRFK